MCPDVKIVSNRRGDVHFEIKASGNTRVRGIETSLLELKRMENVWKTYASCMADRFLTYG